MQFCFWFTLMTWESGCFRDFPSMIVLILLVKEQSASNFNEWYPKFFLLRMSKMPTNWVYGPSGPTVSDISARIACITGSQSPSSNRGLWWHFRFIGINVSYESVSQSPKYMWLFSFSLCLATWVNNCRFSWGRTGEVITVNSCHGIAAFFLLGTRPALSHCIRDLQIVSGPGTEQGTKNLYWTLRLLLLGSCLFLIRC